MGIRSFVACQREFCVDRSAISIALSRQLVEEEIDSSYSTVPSNDEVRSSVRRRLTWPARYPADPTTITRHIGLGDRLVLKVRMSSLDHSRNPINLVTAAVDAVCWGH